MTKARILPKKTFIMTLHQATATHPDNGEEINVSTAITGGQPVITYKGYIVTWDVQDLIKEAVELIDSKGEN